MKLHQAFLSGLLFACLSISHPTFAAEPLPQKCGASPGGAPCSSSGTASLGNESGTNQGAGNPINVINGNKYQQETDLPALPGVLGLEIVRHYNSAYAGINAPNGILGRGWRLSYETELSAIGPSIQIIQADGTRILFARDAKTPNLCASNDPAHGRILIQKTSRGDEYTWVWQNGRRLSFNVSGKLIQIQAPTGEFVSLQRDTQGTLVKVIDPQGRELRLTYLDPKLAKNNERFKGVQTIDSPVGRFSYEYGSPAPKGMSAPTKQLLANLSKVSFPTHYDSSTQAHAYTERGVSSSSINRLYHYEDARHPTLLTGITISGMGSDNKLMNQRISTWAYDETGRGILSVKGQPRQTDKDGKPVPGTGIEQVNLDYSTSGKTILTNSLNQTTTYTHANINDQNRLLEVSGAGCATCNETNIKYAYDKLGRMLEQTKLSLSGQPIQTIRTERDALGRVSKVSRINYKNNKPQSAQMMVRYEYQGEATQPSLIARPSVIAGREQQTRIDYNPAGQPIKVSETGFSPALDKTAPTSIERSATYTYSSINGRSLLTQIDGPLPNGKSNSPVDSDITRYEWNGRGDHPLRVIHPLGLTKTFQYQKKTGRLEATLGLDGVEERLDHNTLGRITRFARAGRVLALDYDARGEISAVKDALGQHLTLRRDAAGHLVELRDTAANRIEWQYDAQGQALEMRLLNPDGSIGQRRAHTSPETAPAGGETSERTGFDDTLFSAMPGALPADVAASLTRALANRPDQAEQSTQDALGRTTIYRYDDFRQLVAEISPVTGTTVYEWNFAGNLVRRIAADGSETRITRDVLGRAIRIQATGEDARIQWGRANKPVHIRYAAGEERFAFNADARLTAHTRLIDGHRFVTHYQYDELGRIVRKILPDNTKLAYRYNSSVHAKPGVLAGIYREGVIDAPIVTGLNRAEERFSERGFTYGNGLTHQRIQNVNGEAVLVGNARVGQSRLQWAGATGGDTSLAKVSYHAQTALGQRAKPDLGLPWQERMGMYLGGIGAQAPPPASQLGQERPDTTQQARFDVRGQLVEDAIRTYHWDGMGRLIEIRKKSVGSQSSQSIARYRYNVFGERVSKEISSPQGKQATYFIYDNTELAGEADGQGKLLRQYTHLDGRPVALLSGRATYYIHTDHRLAPLAVTDKNRQVVWQAKLSDNGLADVASPSALDLPLRGSNQYFDSETGLHYNTHRYLDPHSGRYLSPDPEGLAAGPDLYQFALGQPHRYVDVLGLNPIKTDADVPGAEFGDRLEYVFSAAANKLPASVAASLKSLVSADNIAGTVAIFVLWGASHALGVGFIADIALVGLAYYTLGSAAINFVTNLLELVGLLNNARCLSDLNKAGDLLLATTNILIESAGKKGKSGSDAVNAIFGGGKSKLPSPPPKGAPPPPGKKLVLSPTSIPKVAKEITDAGVKAGKLTLVSPGVWKSTGGLIYGTNPKTKQTRIEHVSEHLTVSAKSKPTHSIFAIPPDKLLGTLDDAWAKKGAPLKPITPGKRTVYEIDTGKTVGVNGETKIRIVIEANTTNEIVSAFPIL